VNLAGANTFEIGNIVSQYSVTTSGAVALANVSGARLQSLTNILSLPYPNLQAKAFADVGDHASRPAACSTAHRNDRRPQLLDDSISDHGASISRAIIRSCELR